MDIRISWATVKDVSDLYKLDKIAHRENKFWGIQSKTQFKRSIKDLKYGIVIARKGKEPIGYLQGAYSMRIFDQRKMLYIENIYTIKTYRKRGIAKMLTREFINKWKGKVNSILLITSDRNLEIFKRLGFKKEMNFMAMRFKNKAIA